MVLAHSRALLRSGPQGATDYIDADLRDVHGIVRSAARTLDFGQPVAVMLAAVLHIPDDGDPYTTVMWHASSPALSWFHPAW